MNCPKCKSEFNSVIDTQHATDGTTTRRRRACAVCNHRWTTWEIIGGRTRPESPMNIIDRIKEHAHLVIQNADSLILQ